MTNRHQAKPPRIPPEPVLIEEGTSGAMFLSLMLVIFGTWALIGGFIFWKISDSVPAPRPYDPCSETQEDP